MIRDPFGFQRVYYEPRGGRQASSVRALFEALPDLPRSLDPVAVGGHFRDGIPTNRSMFAAIRAVPPGHELVGTPGGFLTRPAPFTRQRGELPDLLRAAVSEILLDAARPIAVALSGGLDSAIVLALVREIEPEIPALVLDPQLPGYSEREAALLTARELGAEAIVASVTAEAFVQATPDAIAAMEVPLYNLHPVAKWLLALAARRHGFQTLISGDGVDQIVTRDTSADYLPLVSASFERAGVVLCAPFLDERVVAHLSSVPADPSKQVLRELGASLPIPRSLVTDPKTGRLAPSVDLDVLVTPARLVEIARELGLDPPTLSNDRELVRWVTLALLYNAFYAAP